MARLVFYASAMSLPWSSLARISRPRSSHAAVVRAMTSPFPTGRCLCLQQFGILRIGRGWRLKDLLRRVTEVRGELVKQTRLVNGTRIRASR